MKILNLKDYKRGWIMGDFEPTLYKTKVLEINTQKHQKGDFTKTHYHKIAKEHIIILSGSFEINKKKSKKMI